MENLTKEELLFIFAVKDGRIKEHYELYYGAYKDEPTADTLQSISYPIIQKLNMWDKVFLELHLNKMLMRMTQSKKKEEMTGQKFGVLEVEPSLEEWLWYGISYSFMALKRDFLNNVYPGWEKLVREDRDRFNKKMGLTNKFYNGNVVEYKGKRYYIKNVAYYNSDGKIVNQKDLKYLGCSSFDYELSSVENYYRHVEYEEDMVYDVREEELTFISLTVVKNETRG